MNFYKKEKFILIYLFLYLLVWADHPLGQIDFRPSALAKDLGQSRSEPEPQKLVLAALIFSGAKEAQLDSYLNKFAQLKTEVEKKIAGQKLNAKLAEELLHFLHQRYFKKYELTATSLAELFDKGLFNCVSSSILYAFVLEIAGFNYLGVKTKDHVLIKVQIENEWYDVETTNIYGFNPGQKKEFLDEFGRVTGFTYTPPGKYKERQDINKRELLGLVLHNRFSTAQAKNDFPDLIRSAIDLFTILPVKESFEKLDVAVRLLGQYATYNLDYNSGLALLDEACKHYGDFAEIWETRRVFILNSLNRQSGRTDFILLTDLLKREYRAQKITEEDFQKLLSFMYFKELERLQKSEKDLSPEIFSLLEKAKSEGLAKNYLKELENVFIHNYIIDLVTKGHFDQALGLLAKSKNLISSDKYKDLYLYAIQKKAELLSSKRKYNEALQLIEEALAVFPKETGLLKNASILVENVLVKFIQEEQYSEAHNFLKTNSFQTYLTKDQQRNLVRYYYLKQIEGLRLKNKIEESFLVFEEALKELGSDAELLRHFEVILHNYMITFYEQKNYREAERLLRYGLKLYPQSAVFKKDLEAVLNAQKN